MSDRYQLPDEFTALLDSCGIEVIRLLEVNLIKGRYCIVGRFENRKVLIKWNANDSEKQKTHYRKLQYEKQNYEKLKDTGIIPGILSNSDLFIAEYIDHAETLRQYLLQQTDEDQIFQTVSAALEKVIIFYSELEKKMTCTECETHKLTAYFKSLISSGPIDTSMSLLHRKFNSLLSKSVLLFFRNKISALVSACEPRGLHGDLHLNNFLMDQDRNLYLADLENITFGSREAELAYFYAQLWAVTDYPDRLDREYSAAVCSLLEKDQLNEAAYMTIKSLYTAAVSINPRYGRGKKKNRTSFRLWKEAVLLLTRFKA